MFNTICHQENSNYDSNKILLHTHYFITLKNLSSQNVENNVKQWKLSYFAGGCAKCHKIFGKLFGSFL